VRGYSGETFCGAVPPACRGPVVAPRPLSSRWVATAWPTEGGRDQRGTAIEAIVIAYRRASRQVVRLSDPRVCAGGARPLWVVPCPLRGIAPFPEEQGHHPESLGPQSFPCASYCMSCLRSRPRTFPPSKGAWAWVTWVASVREMGLDSGARRGRLLVLVRPDLLTLDKVDCMRHGVASRVPAAAAGQAGR